MEGKYLVPSPKESTGSPNLSVYGTVNPGCDADSEKCVNSSVSRLDSSFEVKAKQSSSRNPCSCPEEVPCNCGMMKKNITLEPWARYKTITMAVGLSLFGLWIIVIAVVAKQGKL